MATTTTNDACKNDCTTPSCGDGVRTGAEECDDGNMDNTDNCTNTCVFNVCGDTFLDGEVPRQEDCDDGNTSNGDDCLNSCLLNTCGDGFVDLEAPATEACDDGNTIDGDGCSADCSSVDGLANGSNCSANGNASCASGVCDATEAPDTCEPAGVCGNGIVDGTDACDDGNTVAGDGCDAVCVVE